MEPRVFLTINPVPRTTSSARIDNISHSVAPLRCSYSPHLTDQASEIIVHRSNLYLIPEPKMMKDDENLQTMNQIRAIPYNVCISLPLALLCFPSCANLPLRNFALASELPLPHHTRRPPRHRLRLLLHQTQPAPIRDSPEPPPLATSPIA